MKIHTYKDRDELSEALADWLVEDIQRTLQEKEFYSFVLSGGSSPKTLYKLLAESPRKGKIAWEKIHFFIGDERYVAFDDSRHNGKMAYETLLNHVPVSDEQVHLMDTSLAPEEAAERYEKMLHSFFNNDSATFDFVLLGMGADGHTLSLFPGTDVIHEKEKWVAAPFVPVQGMYRITLTQAIVERAQNITFLAIGENKADTLQKVLEGTYQPDSLPSQLINKINNNVHWYIDEGAASKLNKA